MVPRPHDPEESSLEDSANARRARCARCRARDGVDADHHRLGSEFGALDTTRAHVPSDEGLTRVGDLSLGPGRRVSGRVVLSDDSPVPPGTRLLLALDSAFDAQNQSLDEDGRFDLRGVPPGDATLHVSLKGHRLTRESTGYTEARGRPQCVVTGNHDVEGLTLVLEPGEPLQEYRVVGPAPKTTPP